MCVIFIPTLHTRLLRPREIKTVARGHPASQLYCFRFVGVQMSTPVSPSKGQTGCPGSPVPSQGPGEVSIGPAARSLRRGIQGPASPDCVCQPQDGPLGTDTEAMRDRPRGQGPSRGGARTRLSPQGRTLCCFCNANVDGCLQKTLQRWQTGEGPSSHSVHQDRSSAGPSQDLRF